MSRKLGRRQFLRSAALTAGSLVLCGAGTAAERIQGHLSDDAAHPHNKHKLIVIQFGGGTRSSESIDDPEHRYIPRLWNDMVRRGALFTNMRVEGKVVHPNSTGSMVSGHWEWDDIDWTRPVAHPTIFEIYRKASGLPDTSTWAFMYASILAKAGESRADGYGAEYGANVVEPPTISRETAEQMESLLRGAVAAGSSNSELQAARKCSALCRSESHISLEGLRSKESRSFITDEYEGWKQGRGTVSHDAFLTDRVINCMRRFTPDVIFVGFGEIDCAHYGSWSRYVEAIRRTDELTWRIWRATEEMDAYRGRTLVLVLPDHGRQLDDAEGWGFVHHSDFYTGQGADEGCRRVWMLALGPGVRPGLRVNDAARITTVAATGLEHLGLSASQGAEESVLRLIR